MIKNPGKQMRSVWSILTPSKNEKIHGKHPTQKPLKLLDRIVLASTNPGDVMLDPFCGSSTTGVSAILNNRKFIGIDLDKEFLENLSVPRLVDAEKEMNLRELENKFFEEYQMPPDFFSKSLLLVHFHSLLIEDPVALIMNYLLIFRSTSEASIPSIIKAYHTLITNYETTENIS
jgi:hypothetical protein